MNTLYYDKSKVSEEIDLDKTSVSKECVICHYWYFSKKGLNFMFVMDVMMY